ncbi:MAG: Nif3-like dinuclear metal center hexameric protein [Lachnospiraceae bacterium]
MMRCRELIEKLETLSPVSYAEDWDNVGLLAGRWEKEVTKVMIALDASDSVIQQAVTNGVDMLLTHHPLLFSPLKRVVSDDFVGRRMMELLRHDICYYAMHTNFDVMGMADAVADEMNLKKREVLEITYEDDISKEGIGRIGLLPQIMTLEECAGYCKDVFNLEHVKVFGDLDMAVERAAVVPGSGKDFVNISKEKRADVLITGDIGHHPGMDAVAQGIAVIDAGHYGLEKIFVPYMKEFFFRELPQITVVSAKEEAPFRIL